MKPGSIVVLARIRQLPVRVIMGTVRFLPPPDRRADVLEILRSIQGSVRTQPGCVAFDIYAEQGPESAVLLIERWDTEAALEAHLRSEIYRSILGAIELSDERPEIRFEHVSASRGMELIERMRSTHSEGP
jgi:quinol monooxygenase YgiN